MKKLIAVFVCMVMCLTMIPSFFASAAPLPAEAAAAAAEVVAQNDENPATLSDVWAFFSGLWTTVLGPIVTEQFWPALKQVLKLVSPGEFFNIFGQIIKDVVGR